MGTPDFAVPALKALHQAGHHISLVVTQPDRPKGRGRKTLFSPVKQAALALGHNLYQPVSLKDADAAARLDAANADLFVVVAYGHLLTKQLLRLPPLGAINIHASLLPKYRGSAPIHWAIINGEQETGVTTMFMDTGMDTGDILLSEKTVIGPEDTCADLHDRLSVLGGELLIETLDQLRAEGLHPVPQDPDKATYAPLLKKRDGRMDWRRPARQLDAFIRGMTPWPGAFTFLDDHRLKIFRAKPIPTQATDKPGTVVRSFPDELRVATGEGVLSILELQAESAKRLPIKAFLQGFQMPPGTFLS